MRNINIFLEHDWILGMVTSSLRWFMVCSFLLNNAIAHANENATENSTSFTLGAGTTVSSTIQSDEPTLATNGDTFDNDNETFDVFQPIEIPLLYLMVAGVAFLTLTLVLLFIICLLHWSHRNADEPGIELNATRHSRIHHQVASTDIDDEHNSRPTSTAENQYAAEQKNRESTEAAMRRRTQEMKEMETFAPENIPTQTESNPTGAGLTVCNDAITPKEERTVNTVSVLSQASEDSSTYSGYEEMM